MKKPYQKPIVEIVDLEKEAIMADDYIEGEEGWEEVGSGFFG